MTRQLTYSVVADGGTDRLLVPIIQWAVHQLDPDVEILEPQFRKRSGSISKFLQTYDSEVMLIFLHRDSENQTFHERLQEFESIDASNVVPVIPVRMSEAWIIFNAEAIAQAAGYPQSLVSTPKLSEIESISDPKSRLDDLIVQAAGNPTGRTRKRLKQSMGKRRVAVSSYISDFSPLKQLHAFQAFQKSLAEHYPYRHLIDQ